MPHLDDLMTTVCERIPAGLLPSVIVMGSAAIALYGVDLGRDPGDVDLFVSESTFEAWPIEGFTRSTKHGIAKIAVDATDRVEIFAAFPAVSFDEVDSRARSTELSRGVRVAAPEHLLTWKRALKQLRSDTASQEKDANDIRAIEAYLRASRASST